MTSDAERLRLLYEFNAQLATFTDLDELLQFVTARARDLLDAEGCAVLLHDAKTDELYFPIASQRASSTATPERLREIRFPASRGLAGWVLANGQPVGIADVTKDSRFYGGVDASTGVVTRAIIYAPLRNDGRARGLVSVVNPAAGTGPEHVELLDAIAHDVSIAFERASLYSRLREDAREARLAGRVAGWCLAGLGVALTVGSAAAVLAVAGPVSELVTRPGVWVGVAVTVVGLLLARAFRKR